MSSLMLDQTSQFGTTLKVYYDNARFEWDVEMQRPKDAVPMKQSFRAQHEPRLGIDVADMNQIQATVENMCNIFGLPVEEKFK